MKYRPEIDGLRALAVIPVILFHAGFGTFSGGFVGVDVFFVISGYLITSIIYGEIQQGSFSVVRFYGRRIRQILPPLLFICLVSLPFAWLWLLPSQLEDFARSLVAVIVFSSNILFYREGGYFAAATELKPLIHTWSLAVEEQFYIFFPLLLLLSSRINKKALTALLGVLSAVSLGLAEWASRTHPDANYYLLLTRAWELGVGAMLALTVDTTGRHEGWFAHLASSLGIGMTVYSIFTFSETVPVPGLWGLIPVVGAALVIAFATPKTVVGWFLGLRPIVGIGLISYSAYLWHQPLFAFARARSLDLPTPEAYIALVGISLVLAWATWYFIELPFRNRTQTDKKRLVSIVGSGSAILGAFGIMGQFYNGFPNRYEHAEDVERILRANRGLSDECDYSDKFYIKPQCIVGTKPTLLVWGNSFAMHLVDGIKAANPGLSFVQATHSVCGPILGLSPTDSKYSISWANDCLAFNYSVYDYIKSTPTLVDIVLSSPFRAYTDGKYDFVTSEDGYQKSDVAIAFRKMLSTIHSLRMLGKTVWVVSPPARSKNDLGLCLAKASLHNIALSNCDFSAGEYRSRESRVLKFLNALEASGVQIIWLPAFTCREDRCFASKDHTFLYRDSGHLTREGSTWLGLNTSAFRFFNR